MLQLNLIGFAARYNVALRDSEQRLHSAALLRLAGFAGFHIHSGRCSKALVVGAAEFGGYVVSDHVCVCLCISTFPPQLESPFPQIWWWGPGFSPPEWSRTLLQLAVSGQKCNTSAISKANLQGTKADTATEGLAIWSVCRKRMLSELWLFLSCSCANVCPGFQSTSCIKAACLMRNTAGRVSGFIY